MVMLGEHILEEHVLKVVGVRMRQQRRDGMDVHSQLKAPATCSEPSVECAD
jgi:hypothetical protein